MPRKSWKVGRGHRSRCKGGVSWDALPLDLQDVVAGYLSQKDKARMSMVCKSWNAVLQRGRLRLNLKARNGGEQLQRTFSGWASKQKLILNDMVIKFEDSQSRHTLIRDFRTSILPSLTALTSLHISQSQNVHMSVLHSLSSLKVLELVNCELQMGRFHIGGFPLLGQNNKLRKLALTSSTFNLHKTPVLSWNLPNLEFLKLDGLHAIDHGGVRGRQVHIHCYTTERLLSVQCLRKLNLDWKYTAPAPSFSFGPKSFKGVTSLAASCGAMAMEFLGYSLRKLCLENFTPAVVSQGFPVTLTSIELQLGKLGRNESTTQVLSKPAIFCSSLF
eukprot:jgi/Botrbrau1/21077/Bobra.0144s0075.1